MKTQSNDNEKLLINETFIVDHSVNDKWLQWMKSKFIPLLEDFDFVSDIILSKIHAGYNPDGENYALQFQIDKEKVDSLLEDENYTELRKKLDSDYKDKYASFRTTMSIIP